MANVYLVPVMKIAIVTAKHRIYRDFIRNHELDERECVFIAGGHVWRGLMFDRIIFTCFYRDVSEETRKDILSAAKIGVISEYIPCTPKVCDVHI